VAIQLANELTIRIPHNSAKPRDLMASSHPGPQFPNVLVHVIKLVHYIEIRLITKSANILWSNGKAALFHKLQIGKEEILFHDLHQNAKIFLKKP